MRNYMRYLLLPLYLFFNTLIFAQIPSYVPTSGLVSFYELDGNLNDLGPANQPFSAIGTASYGQDRQSNTNSSAVTSRSPLVSYLSNTLPVNKPTAVSFAMWFYPSFTTPASQFPIIGGMRSNTTVLNSWLFYMSQGNALNFGYSTSTNGNNQNINCNTTLAENTWYHLAATFSNADGLKIYVNGVQVASGSASGNIVYNTNSSLVIGNTGASVPALGDQTAGLNDEIGYWNRVLTSSEIQGLYLSNICFANKAITGNTNYCIGQSVNLSANFTVSSGNTISGYQWKRNGTSLTNGGKISGATTANLQITNFALSDTGTYNVVVTSTCGTDSTQVRVIAGASIAISDLIAHYPLNNNANDISGNGYNATATSTTNSANRFGQVNSAFAFNGTSSVVEVAAPTGQTILGNGQNKSVSLWFKRGSTTNGGVLLSYQQASPGNWNALAYIGNDGILRGWMFQGGSAPWSSGVVMDTNWHNLVLVYTTSNQTAYLDGAVVASLSGTPNPGASNVIRIGNGYATTGAPGISTTGNQPFLGVIDEVRFYNKALISSEINQLLADPISITTQPQSVCAIIGGSASFTIATQGSVSYQWQKNGVNIPSATAATYTINNIQSNDLANYRCVVTSTCDNTTTLVSGSASLASVPPSPQPTRVYSLGSLSYDDGLLVGSHHATAANTSFNSVVPDRFNLVNGALSRAGGFVIAPLKSIDQPNTTISFWVNLNNFGTGTRAFFGGANNNFPYHLMANNNQLYFQTNSGITFVNANLPTNGWAHVAVVYQGNTNTFYLNGQQTFTTSNGINLSTNPIRSLMGISNITSSDYLADDLRVFESALTPTQIEGIYANGEAVPIFSIAPTDDQACVGGTIKFRFRPGVDNGVVTVKKNGVALPAGGNVTITDSVVMIANATAADFTNYTINVRKGCASVEKTVNAVQLPSTFYNTGLVRHYRLNNSYADELGGAALTASGTFVVDRYGQGTRSFRKINNSNVQMPQITASPFTLSYWMNFYGGASYGMVTELGTTGVNLYKFGNGVGFDLGQSIGQPYGYNNVNVLQPTQWRMITITHDGSYCKIYVDDQLVTQFRPINNSVSLRNFFPNESIDLDDIRVYNRAISEAEVKGLYRMPDVANGTSPSSVCAGQTINLSVTGYAVAGVNLRYQWTFNGNPLSNGGNVSGATSPNLQITNAQASNQGAYNCIVIGECTEITSITFNITVGAGNVTVTQQPQNQTVCQGANATFSVATQGAAVTYQWKKNGVAINGATAATFTKNNVSIADTGSYTVDIIGGSCGIFSSQAATLTINNAPVVSISPTTASVCDGQSITLTASGGGTYSWSNGGGTNASATYSPSSTTTYTVTVTGTNGCSATANKLVSWNANPSPSILGASAVCAGQSVFLTASGGSSYNWSNGGGSNASATFTPASTTTYTVTATGSNGCSATATFNVTVNANPTASISPSSVTICDGEVTTLTASGGTQYAWSNGGGNSASATFSPTTQTTYTVTVTNAANCSATASATISIGTATSISTQPVSQTACTGSNVTFNVIASGTNLSYVWKRGNTTVGTNSSSLVLSGVSALDAGNYTVEVTGDCGVVTSNIATLTIVSSASISQQPINITACNGTNQILTVVGTGGNNTVYQWKKGTQNIGSNSDTLKLNNITSNDAGTYSVVITGSCGTVTSNIVSVTVNANPTASIAPASVTICEGQSATLTASGGATYSWSNSGGSNASATFSPTTNTTYTVTVTNAANCTATANRIVNVNTSPTASITPSTVAICPGQSTTLTATGGGIYAWSNSGGSNASATFSPTTTTTYTVTVTNANNCTATANATISVNTVSASINGPTTICSALQATLTASGGNSYVWSNSLGTNASVTVSPTSTTTYTVTVTGAGNCTATASQTVSVQSQPTAVINGASSVCAGSSITLTANGGNTYAWANGLGTNASITVSPTATTTYTVTVSIGSNCTATASKTVNIAQPTSSQIAQTICAGGSYSFGGNTITQSGTYTNVLVNAARCDSTVTLNLTVLAPIASTVNASICQGGSYNFNGTMLTNAGTYTQTLQGASAQGCDSSVTLNLTVGSFIVSNISKTICAGESFVFNGKTLTQSGVYADTLATATCDSIVNLTLTVNTSPQPTITQNGNVLSTQMFNNYQWQLNNNNITGATSQNYTATQSGSYTVVVTDANGCRNTSNAINVDVVSVSEILNFRSLIYPNPTTSVLYIEGSEEIQSIQVADVTGRIIISETNLSTRHSQLATDMLAEATYFIHIKTISGKTATKSFVKQ